MRGGATEVNATQKWATSKKRLRTTGVTDSIPEATHFNPEDGSSMLFRKVDIGLEVCIVSQRGRLQCKYYGIFNDALCIASNGKN
jgi:hypothetical protein